MSTRENVPEKCQQKSKATSSISPIQEKTSANIFPSEGNDHFTVFVNRKNGDEERKFTKEHPQNSVYLFPIFLSPTPAASEISTTLKLKTKNVLLEIISPSFSMLNFHFHTQAEKCFLSSRLHKCKAGYQHQRRATIKRCACNMRSQVESKIAIQTL